MGKNHGNYHLQYLFDDLHVINMFFLHTMEIFNFSNERHCIEDKGEAN